MGYQRRVHGGQTIRTCVHSDNNEPETILKHLYPGIQQSTTANVNKALQQFDQRAFCFAQNCTSAYLADYGYYYVPDACMAVGAGCKINMFIHGCGGSAELVGTAELLATGWTQLADKYNF